MLNINSMNNMYLSNYLSSNYNKQRVQKPNNNFSNMYAQNNQKIYDTLSLRYESQNKKLDSIASTNKSMKEFYSDYFPKMENLKNASSKLKMTTLDSAVNPFSYSSSNSDVASVSSGKLNDNKEVSLDVTQIATSQKYSSDAISSSSTGAFSGKTTMSITVGSVTNKFDFDFSSTIKNKDAMQSIADKINKSETKIKATVTEKDGKSMLEFTSSATGEAAKFTLATDGKTDIKEQQKAQDAKYLVDGKSYTSSTNDIKIKDDALSVTLKGKGTTNLTANRFEAGRTLNSIKEFASSYNDVVDYLGKNSSKSQPISNLSRSFSDIRLSSGGLSKIGINVDGSGKISINDSMLSKALQDSPDKVRSLLSDSKSGIAAQTYSRASSAIINSSKLMPTNAYNSGVNYDYRNTSKQYLHNLAIGSLLNTMG